jgi:hypothetical protein
MEKQKKTQRNLSGRVGDSAELKPQYLSLTFSMKRRPSSETNRSWVIQEIRRILWNLKVHCRIWKGTPSVPILSHADRPFQVWKIYFNIKLLCPSGGLLPSGFSTKIHYALLLSPTRATRTAYKSWAFPLDRTCSVTSVFVVLCYTELKWCLATESSVHIKFHATS